jgi:nucleoside-diphosphate-sugar epimerase
MNVLLTGGCGYIGVHLYRQLLSAGHQVKIVDKCLFPQGVKAVKDIGDPWTTFCATDIREMAASDLAGIDAICHLAGLSNDPTANKYPEANTEINYQGTVHLATLAKACGVRRFTFASSASVYGDSHAKALTEEMAVTPCGYYGEAKAKAEEALLRMAGYDFEPVILRQATVSGWSPRMRWDLVVNAMTKSALKYKVIKVHAGGEALRPLIDVQDVAEAHVRFLEATGVGGQVYNVAKRRQPKGNVVPLTEGYTIACLALYIRELLSWMKVEAVVVGDWTQGEGRSYDMSCEKMRNTLGWEPGRGVQAMVSDILDNFGTEALTGTDDPEGSNIGWVDALEWGAHIAYEHGGVL